MQSFICLLIILLYGNVQSSEVMAKIQPIVNSTNKILAAESNLCGNWNLSDSTQTKCIRYNRTIQCNGNVNHLFRFKEHRLRKIRTIIFCGWPNETFDPIILLNFPKLKSLHFEYGPLLNISDNFPKLNHLQNIGISYTQLAHVQITLFKHLPMLKSIDLRRNQLSHLDGPLTLQPNFHEIYLNGNPWNCSRSLKWIVSYAKTKKIADRDLLHCTDKSFKNQNILEVMRIKVSLREMCHNNPELRNCTCSLSFITFDLDDVWRPMYSINCSNLNLLRLPATVPENTTTFYATHNKISSIKPLVDAYHSVHDVYLDHNEIETIETLELDNWLERFRVFSLKENRLKKITAYLLENALERNRQAQSLYLSGNPWHCECLFTLRFQELLQAHRSIIKDFSEIKCEYINDDGELVHNSVLALKRGDVCILPTENTIQPLDLLNAVMATLIVFIIVKLSYDYYHYRKSGRLPWLVTKMP